jgi:hypothetical protein
LYGVYVDSSVLASTIGSTSAMCDIPVRGVQFSVSTTVCDAIARPKPTQSS